MAGTVSSIRGRRSRGLRISVAVGVLGLVLAACASTGGGATAGRARTTRGAPAAANGRVVEVNLIATDSTIQEIAPGVRFNAWTFDGVAPGPVIRVKLGDTVHFVLHNASAQMAHS